LDAQDVAAEVFAVAWRRFDELPDSPDELRMWLYGAARRVVANHHRSRRRAWRLTNRLSGLAEETAPNPSGFDHADEVVAMQALSRLRPLDQELLLLSVWEEISHSEIANIVGISTANVAVRLHRAKQRLRQMFDVLQDPDVAGHVSDMDTPGISQSETSDEPHI
jgi:RNA polymerase sigma-70 factor (ECF subfamily)